MSAFELTDALIPELEKRSRFCMSNFANGDMVGHTGIMSVQYKPVRLTNV
jgi:2,3-bisphosphoglycerate-independent phosphoglycerate mutase